MPEPPKTPPSSDIEGVNRDARISKPARSPEPNAGEQIKEAKEESIARPAYPDNSEDGQ